MVENNDIGDVNLLEWSHELDRALLQLPFKPLQSTTDDGRALFLYKLAYSTKHKEAGLLLLDCDACTAFYEGVSLRTLHRRTRLGTALNGSDDASHLCAIVTVIHRSINAQKELDASLRTTIALESTRFSSSLSISVKSRHDVLENNFKCSFDLDPLDHASLSNMLSSHFVRPLLGLAAVLARSASMAQLDSIQQIKSNSSDKQSTSSDSLELIRRSALSHAGLPVKLLHPLSSGTSGGSTSRGEGFTSSAKTKHMPLPGTRSSTFNDDACNDDHLDDDTHLLLFGPPGCRLPDTSPIARGASAKIKQEVPSSSPMYPPSSDNDDDADITLTAPPASADNRDSHTKTDSIHTRKTPANIASTKPEEEEEQDSDTRSEEESLPMHNTSDAEVDPHQPSKIFKKGATLDAIPQLTIPQLTIPQLTIPQHTMKHNRPQSNSKARQPQSQTMLDTTPPPPTLGSSASQITPSTREAEREEQIRRREQIASIKRGPSTQSTQASSTSKASIPSSSGRKRSRF
ncbi:hypothetical protein NDA17_006839 [Ustilago hordei]|nr:hypothetical protein NDA17_006839 [Ustilago hordei]